MFEMFNAVDDFIGGTFHDFNAVVVGVLYSASPLAALAVVAAFALMLSVRLADYLCKRYRAKHPPKHPPKHHSRHGRELDDVQSIIRHGKEM